MTSWRSDSRMTPQALALMTVVGPPDWATTAFPRSCSVMVVAACHFAPALVGTASRTAPSGPAICPGDYTVGGEGRKGVGGKMMNQPWPCPLMGSGKILRQRHDTDAVTVREGDGIRFIEENGFAGFNGQDMAAGSMHRLNGAAADGR